jgi:hypothetical protein
LADLRNNPMNVATAIKRAKKKRTTSNSISKSKVTPV